MITKFFLNISKEEQLERLKSRLDDPTRNWKFSTEDLRERAFWDDYIKVFNDTLTATNTSVGHFLGINKEHLTPNRELNCGVI